MYQQNLTLKEALSLESRGKITIIDCSPKSLPPVNQTWRDNFEILQRQTPHTPIDKIPSFFSAKYRIEIESGVCQETSSKTWRYVHALDKVKHLTLPQDKVEYVYVLTNPGYPHLVKIGMTTEQDVQKRVDGINATGTVDEWEKRFGFPVSKGSSRKIEQSVHKSLNSFRVPSNKGNSREFFNVSLTQALDEIRKHSKGFERGDIIFYQ